MPFAHMNHLMGAMSRLGIQRLKDDKNADRVFDLIHEEQGLPAERNNRHIIEFINTIPLGDVHMPAVCGVGGL